MYILYLYFIVHTHSAYRYLHYKYNIDNNDRIKINVCSRDEQSDSVIPIIFKLSGISMDNRDFKMYCIRPRTQEIMIIESCSHYLT